MDSRKKEQKEVIHPHGQVTIWQGDNLPILQQMGDESSDLIYIDPPFSVEQTLQMQPVAERSTFFKGDTDKYINFLIPRLTEAYRLLKPKGSFFVHLDYREVHYVKIALDRIFERKCFRNQIIWAYDFGSRSRTKWPAKHQVILWYSRHPTEYCFNFHEMDRIPYMSPKLAGKEKVAMGKTPTDVWWHTVVPTRGSEKTGYPGQKPLGIIDRIVKVHSNPGDQLLDFFAGSGTLGESAAYNGRNVILVDNNPQAIEIMRQRLQRFNPVMKTEDTLEVTDADLTDLFEDHPKIESDEEDPDLDLDEDLDIDFD
jgi:site-specific DNA-methyltransferase (adenine-specific)